MPRTRLAPRRPSIDALFLFGTHLPRLVQFPHQLPGASIYGRWLECMLHIGLGANGVANSKVHVLKFLCVLVKVIDA